MENIIVKINRETRKTFLSRSVIGNDGENLQEKFVFSFDDEFVDGTARLELIMPNKEKSYIMLEKIGETYQLPVKSVMTKIGKIDMQLVVTEGTDDEEIPIFKSNTFFVICNKSINAETIAEDEYPDFIDRAEAKLNQMDLMMQDLQDKVDSGYFNGKDALINGYNILEIIAGTGITIEQIGNKLIISADILPNNHLETSDGNVFMTSDNAYFIVKESD